MRGIVVGMLALGVVAGASAQSLRVSAGYGFSNSFDGNAGNSVKLQGLQLGVDLNLYRVGPVGVYLSPSYLSGKGEGDVYRFLVTGRFDVPLTGFNVKAGVGFARAVDRGAGFDDQNSFVTMLGVGVPLQTPLSPLAPNLEIQTYLASNGALRGWFFGVSAGF